MTLWNQLKLVYCLIRDAASLVLRSILGPKAPTTSEHCEMTPLRDNMQVCSDKDSDSSSSSDFVFSAITAGMNGHDSISFRRELKKNRAKYGMFPS